MFDRPSATRISSEVAQLLASCILEQEKSKSIRSGVRECASIELGLQTLQDILDVLLVPVSVSLIAVLWPAMGHMAEEKNFENLIRRELKAAVPRIDNADRPWHAHLTRRFLHEEVIRNTDDNSEFILSLRPKLSYNPFSMWIEFAKAERASAVGPPSQQHAESFSRHLKGVVNHLEQKRTSNLKEEVWKPWILMVRRE